MKYLYRTFHYSYPSFKNGIIYYKYEYNFTKGFIHIYYRPYGIKYYTYLFSFKKNSMSPREWASKIKQFRKFMKKPERHYFYY